MKIHLYYRGPAWAAEIIHKKNPRKCSAILLVGYSFWYTTAMLVTQVTVFVQHRNPGNTCFCYWYNTAVLVTQSQMELYSVMYQGLANLDVKPMIKRRYDLV